ncbi:hypothetical protein [Aromatoleum evansii]|uniref:hypothetical protein n=1 Tax=Aromatoleum evansii TaxID=59406 RepID=UPI00145D7D04|nr:hypothetical protein [Aromatoleum evansii]NMG30692.1 hypothetical protein [Aromatoleum evansii]
MMRTSDRPSDVSHRWLLVAATSLGLSSLAAAALVLARTPVLTSLVPSDSFPRALVVHVNLATLLWYFAMASALWSETLDTGRERLARPIQLAGTAGAAGIILAGLFAPGPPVLANYVPYIDHPLFLGSLALLAFAAVATAALSLSRPRDAAEWGFAIARVPFLLAALYLIAALRQEMGLIDALWGAGHILQFGFVTLMMAIWLRLAQRAGTDGIPARTAIPLFAAASLPALIAPALLVAGIEHGTLHGLHTHIMRWANWPAPLVFGLLLLFRPRAASAVAFPASLGLYCIGIVAGTAIDDQTTLIPAHYHGTIGAFTLAQMAAVLARLTPSADAHGARGPTRRPLTLYALGTAMLICGLAWSGILGAPRKTGFSAADADPTAILAAALTGLGGAVTIAGVAFFALVAAPRIVRLCRSRTAPMPQNNQGTATMFAAAR